MEERTTVDSLRALIKGWRKGGASVGLVPTMGYLHKGHRSLIQRAAAENDKVVVSVFVNPMQFGPREDLATYPQDRDLDDRVCGEAGASVVFRPIPEEMYPEGFCSFVDMTGITEALCGASRPGHFRGVCTVVNKLFHMVMPDRAYFGEKDAQQLTVIRRMVRDLNMDLEIVGCPIVREEDGLAMSSRNTYLNPQERKAALCLSQAVRLGRELIKDGQTNGKVIEEAMRAHIGQQPLAKIDYISIVDTESLQPMNTIEGSALCALAVYIGKTRLIDNFFYGT